MQGFEKEPELLTKDYTDEQLSQGLELANNLRKWAKALSRLGFTHSTFEEFVHDCIADNTYPEIIETINLIKERGNDDRFIEKFAERFGFCHEKWELFAIAFFIQNEAQGTSNLYARLMWRIYFAEIPETEALMAAVNTAKPVENIENVFILMKGVDADENVRNAFEDTISAFNLEYRHPEIALDHYQHFLQNRIMKEFNKDPSIYHSLYFSVVQSSGYGKSRLLLEAGKTKVHSVYACLRKTNSSGYPFANYGLKKFLTDYCSTISNAELFLTLVYYISMVILGCFRPIEILQNLNIPQNRPLHHFEGAGNGYSKFHQFWDLVMKAFHVVLKNPAASDELKNKVTEAQAKFYRAAQQKDFSISGGFYDLDNERFPSEIVVVFDEARFLLNDRPGINLFRVLRSSQQSMKFQNMVLVFVDTISTISNFSPAYIHDPSARPYRVFELLPVFYEIMTYDSLIPTDLNNADNIRIGELARLFSLGRPVWNACFFSKPNITAKDVLHCVSYAMVKLSNTSAANIYKNYFGGLAVASILFGIWGIMDQSYATMMLSSYMGTALFFGDDRTRMFVHYVSEPILAEAAFQLLYSTAQPESSKNTNLGISAELAFPGVHLKTILHNFEASIVTGLVDVGNIGELVCRMMLSFVSAKIHIDTAKKLEGFVLFSEPIDVSSFLDLLICRNYQEYYLSRYQVACYNKNHESVALLRKYGKIAFTSFETLYSISSICFSQNYLKDAFEHRIAFVGRENQPGCDLVIPVFIDGIPNAESFYSALIVQIKNYKKPLNPAKRFKAAGFKLTPSYIDPASMVPLEKYVSIYMELNFSRTDSITPLQEETKIIARKHYDMYGNHIVMVDQTSLESFLGNDIMQILSALAQKNADYVQKGANKEVLKVMCPLRFGIE